MKNRIPDARFQDDEADRLIANFGVKPAPDKREALLTLLKDQKEPFITQLRERDSNSRHNEGRTL